MATIVPKFRMFIFVLSCSESSLLQTKTGFQRFTFIAKKMNSDVSQESRQYVSLLQDKYFLSKGCLVKKFKNL